MTRNSNTRNETGEIITDTTDIETNILEYYKTVIIFHNMYIMQINPIAFMKWTYFKDINSQRWLNNNVNESILSS